MWYEFELGSFEFGFQIATTLYTKLGLGRHGSKKEREDNKDLRQHFGPSVYKIE
jgi:hypothetical protein